MAEALEDLSSEQQHHASSIKSSGYWCCKVCHDGPKSSFQNYCRNCGSRRELNSISDGMDLINTEGEIANKQSSEFKNLEVPASDWKLAMRGKKSASTKENTGLTYHDIGVKRGKDGLQDWATRHSTVGVKVKNSRLPVVSRRPGKFGINISFSETQLGQVSTAIVKPDLDVKPMKKGLMDGHRSSSVAPAIALYVRALHDYHAEDKTKISLRCGDIIQVVETNESGWWDGIRNGSDGWDGNHHTVRGWFPSNHCTFKTYQEQFASVSQAEPVISGGEVVDWNNATQTVIPYVYACFDYEGECERELSFRRGDAIQVIDRPDSGWWDGVSNGARGWFPSSYCTEHIGHRSGASEAQKETDRTGTEGDFESKDNLYSCTDSLANDSSNTKPGAGSTLESVDAHSHQKRIKVMRACDGCRRRTIKCDTATTNIWPCTACVRLKLHCVPPTLSYDRTYTGNDNLSELERVSNIDDSSDSGENVHGQHMNATQSFMLENFQGQRHVSQIPYNDALAVVHTTSYPSKARHRPAIACPMDCRNRKIKCDEEQPNCANCVENNRNCEGYAMRLSNETQHDSPQLNSPFYRGERTRIAKEARTTAPRALVVVPKANLEYVKHKASNEPLRQTAESRSMQTSDYKDIDSNRFTSLNISVPQHATKPSSSPKFNVSRKERRVHRENPEEEMSTPPDVVTDTSLLIEEVRSGPESLSKECIPFFTGLSKAEWFYQNFKGVLKPSLCVIGLVFLLYTTTSMPEYIYDIRMILPLQWQRHSIFEISTFDFFIAKISQFLSLPLSIAPSMSFVWYCCWSFVGCSLVFSFVAKAEMLGLEETVEILSRKCWKHNRCGHQIFDDFDEVQPGAAERLEQRLNKDGGFREQNRYSHSNAGGSLNSRSSTLRSVLSSTWLPWKSAQNTLPSLPLHQKQSESGHPSQTPASRRPEGLFLLLCIPHRKYATKLVHMDVCTLQSDRIFFSKLKTHYHEMRRRWSSFFSLKTLKSIQFVQFEMYKSELVDIRKTNDIPPETKKGEYRYQPIPAEVIPPVGENHLMHLYDHPEDAENTGVCLQKIPKKVRERLLVCPNRGTGLGWGIHFVEGLNWTKLWWLGLVGFLTSIAFGAFWSVVKDDIQGGFGVTACMMVVLTFTMGILQAAFEPK